MMEAEDIRGPVIGTVMGVGSGKAGAYVVAYSKGEVSLTSGNSKSYISYETRANDYAINTITADSKVKGLGGLLLYILVLKALSEGKSDIFVNPPISLEGQAWCDRNKFYHADPVQYEALKSMIAEHGAGRPADWAAKQMGGSLRVKSAIMLYFGLKDYVTTAFRLPV